MSKEIFFFATKSDLIVGLNSFEESRLVKYVKTGLFDSRDVPIFMSSDDLGTLGVNLSGNHQSESYLVLDRITNLEIREVSQSKGGIKYAIDQMANSASVAFWPGGIYKQDYLICGHLATISNEQASLELFKDFSKTLIKGFKKSGRYYIGPEALKLDEKFRFITMNINQPTEYDFKLN